MCSSVGKLGAHRKPVSGSCSSSSMSPQVLTMASSATRWRVGVCVSRKVHLSQDPHCRSACNELTCYDLMWIEFSLSVTYNSICCEVLQFGFARHYTVRGISQDPVSVVLNFSVHSMGGTWKFFCHDCAVSQRVCIHGLRVFVNTRMHVSSEGILGTGTLGPPAIQPISTPNNFFLKPIFIHRWFGVKPMFCSVNFPASLHRKVPWHPCWSPDLQFEFFGARSNN
jgi:hypothetical protein